MFMQGMFSESFSFRGISDLGLGQKIYVSHFIPDGIWVLSLLYIYWSSLFFYLKPQSTKNTRVFKLKIERLETVGCKEISLEVQIWS